MIQMPDFLDLQQIRFPENDTVSGDECDDTVSTTRTYNYGEYVIAVK